MANFTVSRSTTLFTDNDADGQFDPGDIVTVRIRFTNNGPDAALNVNVTDTMNGLSNPTNIKVTPIAFDDTLSAITGNTPITISKASLLGNDVDPDGPEASLALTVNALTATNGTVQDNGDGTITFIPTTGFNGNATFQYTITDAQGLSSVSTGLVTIPVSNFAWYVDSAYAGANGASDGSYLRPFTNFQPLNDDGTASGPGGADGTRGDDDIDGANNLIFVYNRGGGGYTGGITLENGQQLYGDGHEFTVNNISIGAAGATTGPTIDYSTYGITLADGNTIRGLSLNGTAAGAEGIRDGGATVGNLFIDKTSIGGSGKAVDIDQGGALNVSLTSLSSSSSTSEGVHLQGVSGTFNAAAGTIFNSTGVGFLIGASGGATAGSGGSVIVTYGGAITDSGTHSVEIQDRTGGAATFNGAITDASVANGSTGILIDTGAGFMTFNGQVALTAAGTGNGVSITNNAGATVIFNAGGNGLDITTNTGTGFNWVNGGDLNIGGSSNSIQTSTGVIFNGSNSAIGADKIFFDSMVSTGTVAGTAISLSNISSPGTFNVTTTSIAGTTGASADGIKISGSSAGITFGTTTIGATGDDGIDVSGANGSIAFSSVTMNGQIGNGVEITNASGTVTIGGGNIGNTNDPAGDAVQITGGTGVVTINANITKTTAGNVVEVNGHNTGTITFGGNITATGSTDNGINIINNTGGAINFTGTTKTLATGANNAITMASNTGNTAVTFQNGGLDIDVSTGRGISAAGTTGASSLTISGTGNVIDRTGSTGSAIDIQGVTSNITLQHVNQTVATNATIITLKNTGSTGQFVITGIGTTNNSGGTLNGSTSPTNGSVTDGTAIYLENVANVSLSNMNFAGTYSNYGIRGEQVNNFTLRDSNMNGAYGNFEDAIHHESAIRFGGLVGGVRTTGLTGTALFEGNNISGGYMDAITVFTNSGTLNMTVKDSATKQAVFGHNVRNDIILVESGGTSNVTLNVTGVQFTGSRTEFVQVVAADSTTQNITIANNLMNNGHANIISGNNAIFLGAAGEGSNYNVTYAITGNTLTGAKGSAMHLYAAGQNGTMRGTILNNTIGTPNGTFDDSGSSLGGDGILVRAEKLDLAGTVTHAVRIEGNTIRDIDNGLGAIRLVSNGNATANTNILEATIKNNTVAESGPQIFAALYTNVGGNGGSDAGRMGLDIANNNFSLAGSAQAGNAIYLDNLTATSRYYLPGYAGSQNGESGAYAAPGTASANLHTFLTGTKGNTLVNGSLPSRPSTGIDAPGVVGTLGTAFTLAVPVMAAAPEPKGWEELRDEQAALNGDGGVGEGDVVFNDGAAPEPVGTPEGETVDSSGGSTGGAPAPAPTIVDDGILSQAELDLIVEAAIQRWIDAGASDAQVAAMRATDVSVLDMVGVYLGNSNPGTIRIDSDGAGYGWFIDATPGDDSEFAGSDGILKAPAGSAASGKLDLLTVVMHELGHQIGLDDDYQTSEANELMYGYVNPGERRLPEADEVAAAGGPAQSGAYALTPVPVGTVPAGKTVDVYYDATIDSQTNKLITNLNNTASISGDNLTGNNTGSEVTVIDSLTLGDRIFLDANKNGVFDSGEGVQNVALTLFADTGSVAGELDATDTQLATTTTLAGGLYSFAGLAPGEYIVRVDASNFGAAKPLLGKISGLGAADPDDNADNDDNGVAAIGGSVASKAITLAYNTEPGNGVGNDTNNTLDFGFITPNQAPVFGALNGDSGTFTENGAAVSLDTGGNATVTDSDSANFDGGSLTITVADGANGDSILFGGSVGLDGNNNVSVGATQIGTLSTSGNSIVITLNSNANAANIQTLVRGLQFTSAGDNPTAGTRTITISLKDGDGTDGGAGADTGTATTTVSVVAVNDAPAGADNGDSVVDNAVLTFTASDFSTGMTDPENHGFAGVKITTLPATGTIKLNGTAILAGATITKAQLDNSELTYEPAAGAGGTAPTFTFQVQDNGGTVNNGVDLDQSANTFTITVTQSNQAPTVDLNGADGAGTGFASSYTEGGAAAAIGDTDVAITDPDVGDDILSATITITNPETGDKLNVGTLPGTVTVDGTSTDTVVKLSAAPGTSAADFEAAIEAITFSNTGDDPTDKGTNTSRSITVVVNDGSLSSLAATATVTVTDVNDAPSGTSATITATEDAFRLLSAADLGFTDVDGTFASVTISGVTGGKIYFDSDGTAAAEVPAEATLPQTYTAQQLTDGKVSFRADANANGSGAGTITFRVTDDDGADAASANTLTVDVTPVNDVPVVDLNGGDAGVNNSVNYNEHAIGVVLAPSLTLTDVDDTHIEGATVSIGTGFQGGGMSDYLSDYGATAAPGHPISVSYNDMTGVLTLSGTATLAQYEAVLRQIRFETINNNPNPTRTINWSVTDGSGNSANVTTTVNVTNVNDAPLLDLNGMAAGSDTTVAYTEQAGPVVLAGSLMIGDPDDTHIESATLTITGGLQSGLDYLTIGGLTSGTTGTAGAITFSYDNTTGVLTLTGSATLSDYQAALRAAGFESTSDVPGASRTITWKVNDGTADSNLPTTTVNVTAVNDAPVAQPDNVATPENQVLNGNLFANNGNGVDSDVEGDTITVDQVTVNGTDYAVGSTITMPSGAKLTVNADGTFSYDPNGKFAHQISSAKAAATGAFNDGQTESFTYRVAGGNTATVIVNVTGVDGAGDQLWGNTQDNTITGTPQGDLFRLDQGGDDTVSGLAGNDGFYFGGALTSDDDVDGGADRDYVALAGTYAALGLGAGLVNVELLTLLSGTSTLFGLSGAGSFDYNIISHDANVAAGEQMHIDGGQLKAGEDLTFNGAAETDGSFKISGGLGVDNLTGGSQSDFFHFVEGVFGASDVVNGGAGAARDQLSLRGDYTITFGAIQIVSIENIVLLSGRDLKNPTDYDYNLTMNDGNVSSVRMTIDGGQLKSTESLVFNGSAEDDGSFRIFGGAGADSLTGSQNGDVLVGGGGKDYLKGGNGADVYSYRGASDSTSIGYDQIDGFVFGTDTIDLTGTHDSYEVKNTGALNAGSFDADLAAAMSGTLDVNEAVLFTANSGDLAGKLFLVVDENGVAGYQAGEDYVIELVNTPPPVGPIPDFLV